MPSVSGVQILDLTLVLGHCVTLCWETGLGGCFSLPLKDRDSDVHWG